MAAGCCLMPPEMGSLLNSIEEIEVIKEESTLHSTICNVLCSACRESLAPHWNPIRNRPA